MRKNIGLRKNNGVILIEAILAMGVIVIILTALVTALVSSVSSSNFSREQSQATGYAQEGLEIARNEKDIDFDAFQALSGRTYCLNQSSNIIGPPGTCLRNIDSKFTRTLYINLGGDGRPGASARCESTEAVFVASTLTWSDPKCSGGAECHKIELNSCFVNLNRIRF